VRCLVGSQGSKLLDTSIGDAVALFEGQWMVGGFQRYVWSRLYIFRLDIGLEIEGIGITLCYGVLPVSAGGLKWDAGTRQLRMCRNRESELLTNWRVGCRVECRWKASNSYESEY